jgi:TRAP-type C4-dicarboxylate transport system permease large subunit
MQKRVARIAPELVVPVVIGTAIAIGFTGPFGLIIPAACVLIAAGVWAYRKYTKPDPVAQACRNAVRNQLESRAYRYAHMNMNDYAKEYKRLAKKIK